RDDNNPGATPRAGAELRRPPVLRKRDRSSSDKIAEIGLILWNRRPHTGSYLACNTSVSRYLQASKRNGPKNATSHGAVMKILLTGHKGYIGAVAAPLLEAAGYETVGLDTDLFAGCDFGEPSPRIPEIQKDLRDLNAADLKGFD